MSSVFNNVVSVTEEYLGPAAERFVARQVTSHLDKKPPELTYKDIPKLSEWMSVTMSHLTEDKHVVTEFTQKLQNLSKREEGVV